MCEVLLDGRVWRSAAGWPRTTPRGSVALGVECAASGRIGDPDQTYPPPDERQRARAAELHASWEREHARVVESAELAELPAEGRAARALAVLHDQDAGDAVEHAERILATVPESAARYPMVVRARRALRQRRAQ